MIWRSTELRNDILIQCKNASSIQELSSTIVICTDLFFGDACETSSLLRQSAEHRTSLLFVLFQLRDIVVGNNELPTKPNKRSTQMYHRA